MNWFSVRKLAHIVLAGAMIIASTSVTRAAFHLWDVVEVYSSADGSVQFIEMRAQSGGQENLSCCGTRITSTNSLGSSFVIFGTNLPGDSLNKSCIIGTSNLASIPGGVVPNYVIPPNFIRKPVGGGDAAVIFSGNSSTAVFTNLPSDGRSALLRVGSSMIEVSTNSPRNFYNQSNAIVPVKFETAVANGGNFVISFPTATGPNGSTGPNYAIEAKGDATSSSWIVATNLTGNGTTQSVALPIQMDTNRFFRLRAP